MAVDLTILETDDALKSNVRRDTGQDWCSYLIGLLRAV
jgi:hypothetical protein